MSAPNPSTKRFHYNYFPTYRTLMAVCYGCVGDYNLFVYTYFFLNRRIRRRFVMFGQLLFLDYPLVFPWSCIDTARHWCNADMGNSFSYTWYFGIDNNIYMNGQNHNLNLRNQFFGKYFARYFLKHFLMYYFIKLHKLQYLIMCYKI